MAEAHADPDARAGRFLPVAGCFNFRDLGGYPTADGGSVRTGLLFRADTLSRLRDDGLDAFRALGIATVIDLRAPVEAAERPWAEPPGWAGVRRSRPLQRTPPDPATAASPGHDDTAVVAAHYWTVARDGAAVLADIVRDLAAPGVLPAVFHCTAGKDRTGIVAALVLRLLGVPAGTVADDYALSEIATARWQSWVDGGAGDDTPRSWAHTPTALLGAPRASMLAFLERLEDVHGSVRGFVTGAGVPDDDVSRLRAALRDG